MFQAGKPEKPVLATAYGQYDCGTGTMYVMVRTEPGWQIVPSGGDNYVKIGQTDKRVDGNSGNDGTPPDFEYFPELIGWEASFQIPPGSYTGDDGALNIHAQVIPRFLLTGETAAVENRRLDVVIDCSDVPTPTPTPSPDADPDADPTRLRHPDPEPDAVADGDHRPDADTRPQPDRLADAEPDPSPTPSPTLADPEPVADADAVTHPHADAHAAPHPDAGSDPTQTSRPDTDP